MPSIRLYTATIEISDQCVLNIAQYLRKAIVMYTFHHSIDYYRLKALIFDDRKLSTEIVKVFTKMFTFIHIYEVLISGDIDCDDVVILAEAMKDKSAIARNLVVHLDKSCMRALVDIKIYSRDRAELTCVHYPTFYHCYIDSN